ncbi:GNAT family N-acetyltransferase [Candidatus Micrarchaeota archaeon]|nr:GNAT family N-acetyltransferase [Candidatus Micrarchaeota archaeon]
MVKIRKFKKEDALKVAKLIKITLYAINAKFYPKRIIENIANEYSATGLENKMKTRTIFVATIGYKIIGTAQLTKDGWICATFTHPDHQNQGVGTKLLRTLEQAAKKQNFDALRSRSAINSVEFYKHLGFRVVKLVTTKEAGKTYRIIKKLGLKNG